MKILLVTSIDINTRDNEDWLTWHIVASWRSYNILQEIMYTHSTCMEIDIHINDGILAYNLSQDEDFYKKLILNWYK
jgi:hypothetical protein